MFGKRIELKLSRHVGTVFDVLNIRLALIKFTFQIGHSGSCSCVNASVLPLLIILTLSHTLAHTQTDENKTDPFPGAVLTGYHHDYLYIS